MARRERVNFSLGPDAIDKLDSIDKGERSAFVERAILSTEVDTDE